MAPSEFWRMTMAEFHLIADQREEMNEATKGGRSRLTPQEREVLFALIDEEPEAKWH